MLLVLVVLLFAALWVLGSTVNAITAVFREDPVAGSPFEPVTTTSSPSSGSPTIDLIAQRGRLIVAIQEAPGLAERSPGSNDYTGFDIALLELLARDLGADPTDTSFKPIPASSREAALHRGEADVVLGGYEITAQRRAEVGIAGPYLVSPLRLAVPSDSPATGLDSLGDGEVCAPRDSPAATELAGKLGERLTTRGSLGACANLLGSGVDAIAGDQGALNALLTRTSDELRVVGAPLGSTDYGIGLPPGDKVLRDRVNEALRTAIADGTWTRLYEKHLGAPAPTPPTIR
ncbi:MAG: transporter substrate-binding domain-containing protein [Pseudonocardiaceae bacterium]